MHRIILIVSLWILTDFISLKAQDFSDYPSTYAGSSSNISNVSVRESPRKSPRGDYFFNENGLWGIKASNGETLLKPSFDDVFAFVTVDGYYRAVVKKMNVWFVVSFKGEPCSENFYRNVIEFDNQVLAQIEDSKNWVDLVDYENNGYSSLPYSIARIRNYYIKEGNHGAIYDIIHKKSYVKLDHEIVEDSEGKKGIFRDNEFILSPDYLIIQPLDSGYYIIGNPSSLGIFESKNCKWTTPEDYRNIEKEGDFVILTDKDNKQSLYDYKDNKLYFEGGYDEILPLIGSNYMVKNSELCGIYDISTQSWVVDFGYEKIRPSGHTGVYVVLQNNKKGLYDSLSHSLILDPVYDNLEIADGRSEVLLSKAGKKGYYDIARKKMLVAPLYEDVRIIDGVVEVIKDGTWHNIDARGNVIPNFADKVNSIPATAFVGKWSNGKNDYLVLNKNGKGEYIYRGQKNFLYEDQYDVTVKFRWKKVKDTIVLEIIDSKTVYYAPPKYKTSAELSFIRQFMDFGKFKILSNKELSSSAGGIYVKQ